MIAIVIWGQRSFANFNPLVYYTDMKVIPFPLSRERLLCRALVKLFLEMQARIQ